MQLEPIHQNMSTEFVNLGALVKHLHRLQFVGRIHVELSSYEADIVMRSPNGVHAREYDHITGRLMDGEAALRNILRRSREPNGRIHVYPEEKRPAAPAKADRIFVDEAIVAGARKMAYGFCDTIASAGVRGFGKSGSLSEIDAMAQLKDVVLELLKNGAAAYTKQRLDFEGIFRNACQMNAERYAFLDPEMHLIEFTDERLYVHPDVKVEELANGVSAVLGYMLLRLRESAELRKLHNFTMHRMRAVLERRSDVIDRLAVRRQFEKISG